MRASLCRACGSTVKPILYRSFSSQGHVVVAVGGNALLARGEPMTMENQRKNTRLAAKSLAEVIATHTVTLVHGNGPQVGMLALQGSAYKKATGQESQSLDVLDAETEGMIGYMIEQELDNTLKKSKAVVTLLTQTVVDEHDPAFKDPTKFVGAVVDEEEAKTIMAAQPQMTFKQDGRHWRRVVPSPLPVRILEQELKAIKILTENDCVVICGGGGGIPVVHDPENMTIRGIEAVVDKDRVASMLARDLSADGLMILTDVDSVCTDWPTQKEKIKGASPQKIMEWKWPAGSMGPKIESACSFVTQTQGWACIGALASARAMLDGKAGTRITLEHGPDYLEFY
eukprot:CAMPEP_0174258816 /NCGR_PEP_ID=MMETSP0439-20130205/7751_1 /TAXON_ID=0 /ORGANISM="Stereomyxa ramosa, Strain Chinc5" /LENGTH=341 /DNA_ID=CAMNT_0015342467 /DNA_START=11 /DNA_END=1036 /DNA_ORIENTATION=-